MCNWIDSFCQYENEEVHRRRQYQSKPRHISPCCGSPPIACIIQLWFKSVKLFPNVASPLNLSFFSLIRYEKNSIL